MDVIFRSDSVALEPPETVQLRLDIDTALSVEVPTGDGVFCITILDLVIIDNDSETNYVIITSSHHAVYNVLSLAPCSAGNTAH